MKGGRETNQVSTPLAGICCIFSEELVVVVEKKREMSVLIEP